MKTSILAAALALAFAAAAPAQAQSNPTGPTNATTQKAGEAYPNDKTAGMDKGKPQAMQDAQDKVAHSEAGKATKRTAKKAKRKTANTAHRAADATRDTGNAIARNLPPAPAKKQ